METGIMYDERGNEVEVVRKLEDGYLGKPIFTYYEEYGDEERGSYSQTADYIMFYKALSIMPPIKKIADELKSYQNEFNVLKEKNKAEIEIHKVELSKIKTKVRQENALLTTIGKYPIVQQLADVLTKKYKFVLWLKDFDIDTHDRAYMNKVIKMSHNIINSYHLILGENDYRSDYDRPFLVFQTKDEALMKGEELLIALIKSYKPEGYNRPEHLKQVISKLPYKSPFKENIAVVEAYNYQLSLLEAKEKREKEEKLSKEIAELEAKRKQLEALK